MRKKRCILLRKTAALRFTALFFESETRKNRGTNKVKKSHFFQQGGAPKCPEYKKNSERSEEQQLFQKMRFCDFIRGT